MMAEFAKSRIAKMRLEACYSQKSLDRTDLNINKENDIEIGEIMSWFQIR